MRIRFARELHQEPERAITDQKQAGHGSRRARLARDLGDDLLPRLVTEGKAREHRLDGYWRDLGTVDAYWQAHMELVADDPPFDPGDPEWPLRTQGGTSPAAMVRREAVVEDALLSGGCDVAGTVQRSVLSRGVLVEAGAEVVDSVLLEDVVLRPLGPRVAVSG